MADASVEQQPASRNVSQLAYQYAEEITQMLDRIPRQMLLLLKLNDCLLHANVELGGRVNTFAIAARVATRAICAEAERSANPGTMFGRLLLRLKTWWKVVLLELRLLMLPLVARIVHHPQPAVSAQQRHAKVPPLSA